MSGASQKAPREVGLYKARALRWGVIGLVVWAALAALIAFFGEGFSAALDRFLLSYLVGFVFWTGVALGSLALAMLHQLTGGNWGVVIRRMLEAATRTLPLMALLFIPLAFGASSIFEWARPELATNHIIIHKHPYLNVPFFLGRTAFYFAVWMGLAFFLNKWSLEQDRTGDPKLVKKLQVVSGPGIVLYALTVTFASVDWVMSLDPEWFSTIFGFLFMGGQGLSALALMIAGLAIFSRYEPLRSAVKPSYFHDLGKLMLAFVMLWAYFNFSQFLVIWAGNLPEEIPWYLRRMEGGWGWIGLALVVLHFALPFVLLLSRNLKERARRLIVVAGLVLFMRAVDTIWLVAPEFHGTDVLAKKLGVLLDFGALLAIGGFWMWRFFSQLETRPILPLRDPNWEEDASGQPSLPGVEGETISDAG